MLEVADIFRAAGPAYRDKFGSRMLPSHRAAMWAIEQCRTEALGGHVAVCDHCREETYHYHSCRNRHCPRCQADQTSRWVASRRSLLLPCPYYLVTLTLPSELRPLARSHQREVYSVLLCEAAASVMKLVADSKWVGARPGILAVLHTWTQAMSYHPHAHLLVTAGGWNEPEQCWVKPAHERFLLSGRVLSAIFRAKMKCALYASGLYASVPASAWERERAWVTHCQPAGDGERVLDYLGRYVHRIAITNRRLEHFADGKVTFTFRDRKTKRIERCTVSDEEFIRRFLQHVLPQGFTKVRYYGIFSASSSAQREHARAILTLAAANASTQKPAVAQAAGSLGRESPTDATASTSLTESVEGGDDALCPSCRIGRLRRIAIPRKKWKPP